MRWSYISGSVVQYIPGHFCLQSPRVHLLSLQGVGCWFGTGQPQIGMMWPLGSIRILHGGACRWPLRIVFCRLVREIVSLKYKKGTEMFNSCCYAHSSISHGSYVSWCFLSFPLKNPARFNFPLHMVYIVAPSPRWHTELSVTIQSSSDGIGKVMVLCIEEVLTYFLCPLNSVFRL